MSGTGRTNDGRGGLGSALSGVAVAVGCVLFLGGFVWGVIAYQPYTVPTDSMTPTVRAGDRVLAQRISGDDVRRGDVVVFQDPDWGDMPMVKRVVGVGGDTVACCDAHGQLTVGGNAIPEPYLGKSYSERASESTFSSKVPAGQLFLLGDERSDSLDSRVHLQDKSRGSVPRAEVKARVDAVVWPLGSLIGRPNGFAALPGGVSSPGPLKLLVGAVVVGAVLILGGAAYGPIARRKPRAGRPGRADAGVSARV